MERSNRFWPDDAIVVVLLLNYCGDDPFYPDAVAPHYDGYLFSLLRKHCCAHRLGVFCAELENVANFHRFVDFEHARITARASFAGYHGPEVQPFINRDISRDVDAPQMVIILVSTRGHVSPVLDRRIRNYS